MTDSFLIHLGYTALFSLIYAGLVAFGMHCKAKQDKKNIDKSKKGWLIRFMKFVLPYIVVGDPISARKFVTITAPDIILAASRAEKVIRERLTAKLGRPVMTAVAEVDFSNRDLTTGRIIEKKWGYKRGKYKRKNA